MRWSVLLKNFFLLVLFFLMVSVISNNVAFAQYTNPPAPPGSTPLPYVAGGYSTTQIVTTYCSSGCPPAGSGVAGSNATSYGGSQYAGFYQSTTNGNWYPIGAGTSTIGNNGNNNGCGPAGCNSCTGVYDNCTTYSLCTVACGGGTQTRYCFDTGCGNAQAQSQACNVQACGPWTKLKDSSYVSVNPLNNPISLAPAAYDADDTTQNYFIVGSGGVVAAPSVNIDIDNFNSTAKTSNPSYKLTPYTTNTYSMTPTTYLEYIKARKQPTAINSLGSIASSGTYIISGNVTIDSNSAPFNQAYNIVLVTTGTVTINAAPDTTFTPGGSVAIIASTINFSAAVTQAKGIFIASSIDTGTTANQGLKIIGNLIDQTALANNRQWSTTAKPSVFIKFDQTPYINLLPYLGTARYEWTQMQ